MVDEFQDTNRLQLDVLEALERDNLFAVGDEFQSIYGFRHADVTIFRERRAALGERRVRPLTANFRSREELLDVLNAAYAPQWPERFAPLLAGNGTAPDDSGELRLFDPGDPGGAVPSVELLVTDSRGWDEDTRLGLAGVETKPHRRAEARALAHRLREEIDVGRPARDIVVLVRATASLRVLEEALEEQGVTDLRRRRARLLVPAARPRRPRLPRRAGEPARRGGAPRRSRLAVLRRRRRRADPARRGRPRAGGGVWAALRAAAADPDGPLGSSPLWSRRARAAAWPSPRSSRTSGRTRSGCPSRCCSSARSRGRATTSRCSRARAASGGSRTCAS